MVKSKEPQPNLANGRKQATNAVPAVVTAGPKLRREIRGPAREPGPEPAAPVTAKATSSGTSSGTRRGIKGTAPEPVFKQNAPAATAKAAGQKRAAAKDAGSAGAGPSRGRPTKVTASEGKTPACPIKIETPALTADKDAAGPAAESIVSPSKKAPAAAAAAAAMVATTSAGSEADADLADAEADADLADTEATGPSAESIESPSKEDPAAVAAAAAMAAKASADADMADADADANMADTEGAGPSAESIKCPGKEAPAPAAAAAAADAFAAFISAAAAAAAADAAEADTDMADKEAAGSIEGPSKDAPAASAAAVAATASEAAGAAAMVASDAEGDGAADPETMAGGLEKAEAGGEDNAAAAAAAGNDLKRKKVGRPPLAEAGHITAEHPLPLYKGAARKKKRTHEELIADFMQEELRRTAAAAADLAAGVDAPSSPKMRVAPVVTPSNDALKCSLEAYEEEDKRMTGAAIMLGCIQSINIHITDVVSPTNSDKSMVGQTVPLHVPEQATVAFAKRAMTRLTGFYVWPSMQKFYLPAGEGEEPVELDDSATLQFYGIVDGSTLSLILGAGDVNEGDSFAVHRGPGSRGMASPRSVELDADGNKIMRGTKKNKWTVEQVEALVAGVEAFGFAWSMIQTEYGSILGERTQVNLKDKWRNLQIGMSRGWSNDRAPIPEALKAKITKLHNWQGQDANAERLLTLAKADAGNGSEASAEPGQEANAGELLAAHVENAREADAVHGSEAGAEAAPEANAGEGLAADAENGLGTNAEIKEE